MRNLFLLIFLVISLPVLAAQNLAGTKAPDFDLPDQNGVFHKLLDYKGQWLVLYFYPKDDTPGCTTEAKNFTSNYQAIKKLGAVVVGSSLDTIASHKEFEKKYNIAYTLLADKDEVMASAYQVISKTPFFHHAKRQTFIIAPDGIIAKHYSDVSPSSHSIEVINDLKELIAKDKKDSADISRSGFENKGTKE